MPMCCPDCGTFLLFDEESDEWVCPVCDDTVQWLNADICAQTASPDPVSAAEEARILDEPDLAWTVHVPVNGGE